MTGMERWGADDRVCALARMHPDRHLARVISQSKDIYRIATAESELYAEISGRFRFDHVHLEEYPAVGDFVMVDRVDEVSGNAIIHDVLPRKSAFSRTAVGSVGEAQVIAANIDVLFVCMALTSDYNLSRLERYLSSAWASGAVPVVVLTKADLSEDPEAAYREVSSIALGVDVILSSVTDEATAEAVLAHLGRGMTASFVGSSGVGKSTLVNLIAGEDLLAIGGTREDGKGRHTTTRRELFVLPQGQIVIDTPGMRELGVESADLDRSFADIDELALGCRFKDCRHEGEPGCAVQAAIDEGIIDERRLESYRKLEREAKYLGMNSRQIETEKLSGMFEDVGGMKNARKYIKQNDKRRGSR